MAGAIDSADGAGNGRTAAIILNHGDNGNAARLAGDFGRFSSVDLTVVVDNTGDGGLQKLDGEKAALLKVENRGYSAGNNEGLAYVDAHGGAEFVVISNPDVFVGEESVRACLDFLRENPSYAVAAPRMHASDGTPHHLAAWRERTFLCDLAYSSGILSRLVGMRRECYPIGYLERPVADVDCVAGSFFVVRRRVLSRAGDFDERTFLYYEEDILGYKLKRLGYKTAVLGGFGFVHSEGASVSRSLNYLKRYLAMQRSRLYFHRRYIKTAPAKLLVLYLATALGTAEKSLKTLFWSLRRD